MSEITDIPERFLWCRDVLHSWDPYDAKIRRNKVAKRREMNQVLLCTRCGTFKTRVMTLAGILLRNSYVYPDGYLLTKHGRLTPADRGEIRLINLKKSAKAKEDDDE